MTGVSECSQQRGNLKDNRYKLIFLYNKSNIKFYLTYQDYKYSK
ncbi:MULTISPECIES: hypothetical protein [Photorhabdus]|nr:hypothetical protein [Photorhabdus asymbiotica]